MNRRAFLGGIVAASIAPKLPTARARTSSIAVTGTTAYTFPTQTARDGQVLVIRSSSPSGMTWEYPSWELWPAVDPLRSLREGATS